MYKTVALQKPIQQSPSATAQQPVHEKKDGKRWIAVVPAKVAPTPQVGATHGVNRVTTACGGKALQDVRPANGVLGSAHDIENLTKLAKNAYSAKQDTAFKLLARLVSEQSLEVNNRKLAIWGLLTLEKGERFKDIESCQKQLSYFLKILASPETLSAYPRELLFILGMAFEKLIKAHLNLAWDKSQYPNRVDEIHCALQNLIKVYHNAGCPIQEKVMLRLQSQWQKYAVVCEDAKPVQEHAAAASESVDRPAEVPMEVANRSAEPIDEEDPFGAATCLDGDGDEVAQNYQPEQPSFHALSRIITQRNQLITNLDQVRRHREQLQTLENMYFQQLKTLEAQEQQLYLQKQF